MIGPSELDVSLACVRAETGDPVELGDVELEAHLLELENCPWRETVATGLVPGVFLRFDQGHLVAVPGEPVGGGRSGRASTDYEDGG